ncbi:hypothetical protein UFOVP450_149 [uncultured Caudovirales phage]|uniref:Uncharacterized protein n=1 Tax=uncultured Caudovirales phage TaxID=2100421 RepID=A0A6J5MEF5_9CAUD|nr:hypothetical protein UFOVP450_149 [uncultured Caudovirales phage]
MKLSQFKSMLRELIREEVQTAVRTEIKKLNESKQSTPKPDKALQVNRRTTPLVTLDEPFTTVGGPLGDLLNETAQSMAGFGDESEEQINPDFPTIGSSATDMFVRDYSSVLKRSEELSNPNFRP